MDRAKRKQIVPFPGVMRLGVPSTPIFAAAADIINISYLSPEDMKEGFDKMKDMLELPPGKGLLSFNVKENKNSVFVHSDSPDDLMEYVQIWATERLIK